MPGHKFSTESDGPQEEKCCIQQSAYQKAVNEGEGAAMTIKIAKTPVGKTHLGSGGCTQT